MAIAYLLFSSVFGISVLFLKLYSVDVMTQSVAKVLMIMYIVIFLFKRHAHDLYFCKFIFHITWSLFGQFCLVRFILKFIFHITWSLFGKYCLASLILKFVVYF